jgi:small-conductance mechanosensitive channel
MKMAEREMPKRAGVLIILAIITFVLWLLDYQYPSIYISSAHVNPYIIKGFYTFLALTIIYLIFKVVFEGIFVRGIKSYKARYSFRKAVSVIYLLIFLAVLIAIWIQNPQNLLIAYGLIGAGIAIALQDFFKNFVGGILILVNGIYRVGDRIEMASKYGDVIEIGVFYTTLMEMREWIAADQATGRIATIPNGLILSGTVNNYTKDHGFIWDEINIPITYGSDWREAQKKFLEVFNEETATAIKAAEEGLSKLKDRYYIDQKRHLEPNIFIQLTDNWVAFNIRFITKVEERRALHDRLSRRILEVVEASKNIKIASETLDITHVPELKVNQKTNKES